MLLTELVTSPGKGRPNSHFQPAHYHHRQHNRLRRLRSRHQWMERQPLRNNDIHRPRHRRAFFKSSTMRRGRVRRPPRVDHHGDQRLHGAHVPEPYSAHEYHPVMSDKSTSVIQWKTTVIEPSEDSFAAVLLALRLDLEPSAGTPTQVVASEHWSRRRHPSSLRCASVSSV